ncbi:MAG: chorismate synthase [Acidobacteriota bacterium]|nr:chorismate synthase [Acidobacteriota bacterium]
MNFRFTTAGESHGRALLAVVEGIPAGLSIDPENIDHDLKRRMQGYGRGGRMKIENDRIEIISGVRHGFSIGSPISFLIENKDFVHWEDVMSHLPQAQKPKNNKAVKRPRPGHADLAGGQKYQTRDLRNVLERASARETAARVACGGFAKAFLKTFDIEILSHVTKLGSVPEIPIHAEWDRIRAIPDDSPLRCVDRDLEASMMSLVDEATEKGDTLGGVFEVVAVNVPAGIGSHTSWSEKLDGRIARAIMSIQAVKGVEIGDAVENAGLFGSQVHDEITYSKGEFGRTANRAGGLEGGITNGQEIRVRGYKKPISTLRKRLKSVNIDTKAEESAEFERSDITAVPAAGVIGESMLAMVLANSFREKFGGDSMDEVRRNFDSYVESVKRF